MMSNVTPEDFPKGTTVTIVKGRKVPHGTTGVVFWAGWCKYKEGQVRIGFKEPGSNKAIWASHWMVDVLPEQELLDWHESVCNEEEGMFDEPTDSEPYEVAHGPAEEMECPF